jgi:hypothetical protein
LANPKLAGLGVVGHPHVAQKGWLSHPYKFYFILFFLKKKAFNFFFVF